MKEGQEWERFCRAGISRFGVAGPCPVSTPGPLPVPVLVLFLYEAFCCCACVLPALHSGRAYACALSKQLLSLALLLFIPFPSVVGHTGARNGICGTERILK